MKDLLVHVLLADQVAMQGLFRFFFKGLVA
jgi:hypothetical protein